MRQQTAWSLAVFVISVFCLFQCEKIAQAASGAKEQLEDRPKLFAVVNTINPYPAEGKKADVIGSVSLEETDMENLKITTRLNNFDKNATYNVGIFDIDYCSKPVQNSPDQEYFTPDDRANTQNKLIVPLGEIKTDEEGAATLKAQVVEPPNKQFDWKKIMNKSVIVYEATAPNAKAKRVACGVIEPPSMAE